MNSKCNRAIKKYIYLTFFVKFKNIMMQKLKIK